MTNSPFTEIGHYQDVESLNYYTLATTHGIAEEQVLASLAAKSRDHARTPVHWDDTEHAGFTTGTPWYAANRNYVEINAQAALADPGSVFAHYQALIRLRHDDETVREGRFELLLPDHDQIWAFTRTLDDDMLLVLANCSSTPAEIPAGLPDVAGADLVLGTHPEPDPSVLAPWESWILRLA